MTALNCKNLFIHFAGLETEVTVLVTISLMKLESYWRRITSVNV